jgi:hypothetical protein
MQVNAIFIPAEAPVASNASRPSSPAASSFGATLASSISSSAPPNLEAPIKHQSVDGQPVQSQSDQARSEQEQSVQDQSIQDQSVQDQSIQGPSVMDRVTVQSGAEFELTPDEIKLVPSLEDTSTFTTAPGGSVTSGRTLKLSNPNLSSIKSANKAAANRTPSSPVSPTATGVVPSAAGAGASLAHASFLAFELLGLSTPAPNLPDAATPDPAMPDPATPNPAMNEQPLAGQLRSKPGGASVSATNDSDILPASSNVLNSNPVNQPAFSFAPTKADSISTALTRDGSESAESPAAVGQANSNPAPKTAFPLPNRSALPSIAAAQSPAQEASPTKATPTPLQMKASPVPLLTAMPAAPTDDNQFDTSLTAEPRIPVVPANDIQTIAFVTSQPAPPTGATPSAQLTSPSLPNNPPEQRPVLAAALSAAATINNPGMPSAGTLISIAQPPVLPVPPPAVSDKNVLPRAEPPAQMQLSIPQSSGSNVNPVSVSFRPFAAEPALPLGSAPRDSVPVQLHASDAKIAVPETSGPPETMIVIDRGPANARPFNVLHRNDNPTSDAPAREANDGATNDTTSDAKNVASSLNSNLSTSNLTTNSNSAASPTAAPAGANDAAVSAKAGVVSQVSSTAASQPSVTEKKSIPTIQTNSAPNTAPASGSSASSASSSSSISSGGPPVTGSSQSVPVVAAPARETSMPGTASAPAASSSSSSSSSMPAPQTSSDASLPQAHQMLDSAPAAPMVPATPVVPGSAADLQMNGQMHMGVRTDAFGTVEIHTVVQQSQIGITVHADRDISRWFSSEVPGLESGLNNSHLNLTGVNFDHGRSGVQTATGFSNGQPSNGQHSNGQTRQNSSQTPGSPSAGLHGVASPEPAVATESTVDIFPSDRSSGSAGNHFSFHV